MKKGVKRNMPKPNFKPRLKKTKEAEIKGDNKSTFGNSHENTSIYIIKFVSYLYSCKVFILL